ncbi:MAG: hypothetical protein JO115_01225 [Pseudonocardiales bacterium]|nr:hypothetical protein [Pseudonocardiales bacterium]
MRERGVTEADVERVLTEYVESVDGRGGRRYKGPGTDGRMLKVWLVPKGSGSSVEVVKSVAWEV